MIVISTGTNSYKKSHTIYTRINKYIYNYKLFRLKTSTVLYKYKNITI